MTQEERTEGSGQLRGRPPQAAVGDEGSSRGQSRASVCSFCSVFRAFARGAPSAISESDRVEYAAHLVAMHGFVR